MSAYSGDRLKRLIKANEDLMQRNTALITDLAKAKTELNKLKDFVRALELEPVTPSGWTNGVSLLKGKTLYAGPKKPEI